MKRAATAAAAETRGRLDVDARVDREERRVALRELASRRS
jgi:hypothetical protein